MRTRTSPRPAPPGSTSSSTGTWSIRACTRPPSRPARPCVAPRKINVRGTSGAGKSTFAAELATRLGVPHIELDALHHGPNWAQPTAAEFQARVKAAMAAAPDGWVIDGNYDSKLGGLVTGAADIVVWLDPPLYVVF